MKRYVVNVIVFSLGFAFALLINKSSSVPVSMSHAYVNYPYDGKRKSINLDICSSSTQLGYSEKEIDEDEAFSRSYWVISVNGQNYVLVPSN